jgi:hypothetical protein
MTSQEAIDAMLGVFAAYWDVQSNVADPVYNDVPGPVPLPQIPWAKAFVKHDSSYQKSLTGATGQIRYENVGSVWIYVYAPIGDGMKRARTLAEGVVNAYRSARNLEVWFRNHSLHEIGESGNYVQVNVSVNFNYDTVR